MSESVDWRALARKLGTISFTDGGWSERGGGSVAARALNLIIGENLAVGAVDFYLSHEPGREVARSVLRMLRPSSATERCLEIFRSDPDSEVASHAIELLRSISNSPVLEHFDELMASQNANTRAWTMCVLDGLYMAGELEIEDGWSFLEIGLNDEDTGVVMQAERIKEMWERDREILAKRVGI